MVFLKMYITFLFEFYQSISLCFITLFSKREGIRVEPLLLAIVSQPWCIGNIAHERKGKA